MFAEFKKNLTQKEANRLAKMSLIGTIIGVFLSTAFLGGNMFSTAEQIIGLFGMLLVVISYYSAHIASKNKEHVPKMATVAKTIIYIWIIIIIGAFLENHKNK